MSSIESRADENSNRLNIGTSRDSTEGTVDHLNEAPRWYSPDEVAYYLRNNFDVYASDELAAWIADGYQMAFDKGYSLRDGQPG